MNIHHLAELVSCSSAKKFNKLRLMLAEIPENNVNPTPIYESILQLYLFNGFPCTIESLKIFKERFPKFTPDNEQYNVNLFEKRGIINCKQVYNGNFDKLQLNIANMSPDLAEWMIVEGYGKLMGRSGLSLQDRELLNVAMLCTNYAEHQLYSHIKGSFNTGSNYNTIKKVIVSTKEYNTHENLRKSQEMLDDIRNSIQSK